MVDYQLWNYVSLVTWEKEHTQYLNVSDNEYVFLIWG